MKLRNKILAMAVVAVAGMNVYLANDIRVQRNELSLLNLENIAEAEECKTSVETQDMYNGHTLVISSNSCTNAMAITDYNSGGQVANTYTCDGTNNTYCDFTLYGQHFEGKGNKEY